MTWQPNSTFDFICESYVKYVTTRFGKASVVFDGYDNGPSTKGMAHLKRSRGKQCPVVEFTGTTKLTRKKEEFLQNCTNKQRIILAIGEKLSSAGCSVQHASADADVLIATTAIHSARTQLTCLIGNDTDLLILLLYHVTATHKGLYFRSETKASNEHKLWNICSIKEKLRDMCGAILFLHAFLGCDTTSRLQGIGKSVGLSLYRSDPSFREAAKVFMDSKATKDELIVAGEQALLRIYKGKPGETLVSLRHRLFLAKLASSSAFVCPDRMPPTPSAAKFHSFRVYLQVMEWKSEAAAMKPENWGWRLSADSYIPVMTEKKPAPQSLLQIIHCKCKSGCDTARCTCRKNGMPCTLACGECMGTSCNNSEPTSLEEEEF